MNARSTLVGMAPVQAAVDLPIRSRTSRGTLLLWLPIALLALVPVVSANPYFLSVWTFIVISLMVVVGLDLLLGFGGQLSLGHGVFVSIGAYSSALLTTRLEWSGWVAMPCGMLAAAAAALIVGIPTLRLRGYYLAMATLGFPVVLDAVLRNWSGISGGSSGVTGIPRLAIAGYVLRDPDTYFYFALTMLCAVYLIAQRIAGSSFGLALKAVHVDEAAAAARGVDVARTKILVFVCSAAFAALGGSVYAHYVQFVAPDTFGIQYSIGLVVMLVVGGAGRLWGGVLGTVALMWLPEALRSAATWEPIIFGAVLALVMLFAPHGIAGLTRRRAAARHGADRMPEEKPVSMSRVVPGVDPLLRLEGVRREFGGVVAVDALDYSVGVDRMQAIIGPNGAGKSTVLALIAGTFPPSRGTILLDGTAIERLPAHRRARLGIGRTFQQARLIGGLTVYENVLLGCHASRGTRSRDDRRTASRWIGLLGLADVAGAYPSEINQFLCRLTEIGAALAGRPRLLLLDEPGAGLSASELDRLVTLLRTVRDGHCAVLLVDHVMQLVMSAAERILVLEHGIEIAEGAPADIVANPQVRAAYLGEQPVASAATAP